MTTGETCTVTCKPGSEPNSAEMTCDASGLLTGTLPVCRPATCPNSPALNNASIAHTCTDLPFGRSCSVFCAPGYELVSGDSGELWQCEVDGGNNLVLAGTLPNCARIQCPSLNPSDVLTDNCTNLLSGESCEQRCVDGYLPVNASSRSYSCDLQGSVTDSGAAVQCVPVPCNTSIMIPNVLHTCADVVAGDSCFAFCREGFALQDSEVPQWVCSADEGVPPVSTDVLQIDGYTLRGNVPVCVAQPCEYNLPVGAEFAHDCVGTLTDATCTVECAEGYYSAASTWTCLPDGVLNGSYPECLEITSTMTSTTATSTSTVTTSSRTTTTFWNGTVLFDGYADLAPMVAGRLLQEVSLLNWAGRGLQGAEGSLNLDFASDAEVRGGLEMGFADMLNVSAGTVEVNLTLAMANGTGEEIVRAYFTAYRPFVTIEDADSWLAGLKETVAQKTIAQVQDHLNTGLDQVNTSMRVGAILYVVFDVSRAETSGASQITLTPAPAPEEEEEEDSNIGWFLGLVLAGAVLICLFCFLYYQWQRASEEEDQRYASKNAEPVAVAGATPQSVTPAPAPPQKAEDPEKNAIVSFAPEPEEEEVVDEMTIEMQELEKTLDEFGIFFDENEEQKAIMDDGALVNVLAESGILFQDAMASRDSEAASQSRSRGSLDTEGVMNQMAENGIVFQDTMASRDSEAASAARGSEEDNRGEDFADDVVLSLEDDVGLRDAMEDAGIRFEDDEDDQGVVVTIEG